MSGHETQRTTDTTNSTQSPEDNTWIPWWIMGQVVRIIQNHQRVCMEETKEALTS